MLQLFTDTSANLPVALTKQHHITVVPFSYTVDGKETDYPDDVEFDGAAFYGAMRRGAVVKTSMVNPALMAKYFERALSQGDDVLYVGMSGGISGTAQAAVIAAGELTEKYPARKIITIDTYAASLGEGLQVLEAARMIEKVETQSGFRFQLHHCCNAGGIASYPEWAWDMVRCGIILYGSGDLAEKMGMQPVMSLKTRVATIKNFAAGEPISYGRTYFTQRPSRIAVLPIGYADGLHRALSNQIEVLTPYGRAKQVGRICMDMCMIDVTDLPQVKSGDEVEIFGEHILCADDAALCDTIPYELMCAVSKRVPRVYRLNGVSVDKNLQPL